jgi:hypothetical protein
MLKLNGAWLCGLSSVPQGSGLSRLRSSGMCTISCCFVERLGTSEKWVPVEVQRWGCEVF